MTTTAIVLAGGAGTRLQASENKVYLPVAGRPLLAWSLQAFQDSPLVDRVVLVVRSTDAERAEEVLAGSRFGKVEAIVEGGATRHASEQAGLEAIADDVEAGVIELICIHDAARPFVTQALLARVIDEARAWGGAVPGFTVAEPALIQAAKSGEAPAAVPTGDLRRVQTPQAFHARELLEAYRRATAQGFAGVDTSESVERFSDLTVHVVAGDPDNIKVTFVEDLFAVEDLATQWARDNP